MQVHRHRFPDVRGYLHHREPYLLIDRVAAIEDDAVVCDTTLSGDEAFFRGHFPGAPVLPGALMQEMTTQAAGVLIAANYNPMDRFDTSDPNHNQYALGVLVRVRSARYRGFARPGDALQIRATMMDRVDNLMEFKGSVSSGKRTLMQNRFQLSNILSSTLSGNA